MFIKKNSIILVLAVCLQIYGQNSNYIEFQDTIANLKTGAIGYKGNAASGHLFFETPNSPDVKIQNGNVIVQGSVTANKFYKGAVELDSVKSAFLADSTKKIPDGSVTNAKLSSSLRIKDENLDSISWSKIKGMPAGFADGVDNAGGGGTSVADSVRASFIADSCKKIPDGSITAAKFASTLKIKADSSRAAFLADSVKRIPKNVKVDSSKVAGKADSLGSLPASKYLTSNGIDASVISNGVIDKNRIPADLSGKALKADTIYLGNAPQYDAENPMIHVCPANGAAKLRLAAKNNFQTGVEFFNNGNQSWYIYNEPSNNELRFFNNNNRLYLNQQGYLGIGASASTYPLEVSGDIKCNLLRSQGVVVNGTNLNVPDYVFSDSYQLKTLNQVETFIKTHKHLPEIQSADEIKENGVDLVKMNLDLLKKIEEMTLYLLDQNKKIESLNKELESIRNKLNEN